MKKTNGGYNVPETWDDITMKNLADIQSIESAGVKGLMEAVGVFNRDRDISEMELTDLLDATNDIFLLLSAQPQPKEADTYSVDGIRYKVATADTIDFQQFIDVNALKGTTEAEQIRNLPLILSVITENRPKEAREWADEIAEKVSAVTALGCTLFFSRCLEGYINAFRRSLQKEGEARTERK